MINAPLWTELFISNKEKLAEHIENFQKKMEEFKQDILNEDSDALLEDTREKRMRMGSIRSVKKN